MAATALPISVAIAEAILRVAADGGLGTASEGPE